MLTTARSHLSAEKKGKSHHRHDATDDLDDDVLVSFVLLCLQDEGRTMHGTRQDLALGTLLSLSSSSSGFDSSCGCCCGYQFLLFCPMFF